MAGQRRVRAVVLLGALIAWSFAAFAPVAMAQEYGGSSEGLVVDVADGTLEVSGDGFMPNSAVRVALTSQDTGQTIDLGVLSSDASGAVAGQFSLPDDLPPGRFTLSVTGMAADGSTRVLSSELEVTSGGAEVVEEPSGGLPAGAIAGIAVGAAALVAAGWWLFLMWRRRRDR